MRPQPRGSTAALTVLVTLARTMAAKFAFLHRAAAGPVSLAEGSCTRRYRLREGLPAGPDFMGRSFPALKARRCWPTGPAVLTCFEICTPSRASG
jgi:hypothetical protein